MHADKIKLVLLITVTTLFSCANNQSPASVKKTQNNTLTYSSVALYTIDQSIYTELDTINTFPDGKQAYQIFLGGMAFIDSSGQPIHDRYRKFVLTKEQDQLLKDSFLYKFCDNIGHACTPVYRDVLVFYDSSGSVVEQVQICFGCHETNIYPSREFMCQEESDLNYTDLKQFISSIRH